MRPAQVKGAVREGLHVIIEVHQARDCACESGVVVYGHLIVRSAAPPARVLKAAAASSLFIRGTSFTWPGQEVGMRELCRQSEPPSGRLVAQGAA